MAKKSAKSRKSRLYARGGGNATAGGVNFQSEVGACFAAALLADRPVDSRLNLGNARIERVHFESEAPVDDIVIDTSADGRIFHQAKTSLTMSEGELGEVASQIVRQYEACTKGSGSLGWDRPLDVSRDRIVIAVGPSASGPLKRDLALALNAKRAPGGARLPQAQINALKKFIRLLRKAWKKNLDKNPAPGEIEALLPLVSVMTYDIEAADRVAAIATLGNVVEKPSDADSAYTVLSRECEKLMKARHASDAKSFRQALEKDGVRLLAPQNYRADVQTLKLYSRKVSERLSQHEHTKLDQTDIQIDRHCTSAVVEAARDGSLVLVGEPGAGKSAVVSAGAERLKAAGSDVIELAVDRLPVTSLDGLRIELGLQHGLREVLENWPGDRRGYVFIDALDANRGGEGEAVFRTLIGELIDIPGSRWTVVASIRTFDLRLGTKYRDQFVGSPPDPKLADPEFSGVRHVHIPRWSDEEFQQVLAKAPTLGTALTQGGKKLNDLAHVPFNTRLLAELLSGGLSPHAFSQVDTQVQLLSLYWEHRVLAPSVAAESCIQDIVAEMVANRRLRADRLKAEGRNEKALTHLLTNGVFVVQGNRDIEFRHHILFDYAASRVYLDASDIAATAQLLKKERGLGLMLAPALSFAFQDLWTRQANQNAQFWAGIVRVCGDIASDPVARSVAARSACELPSSSTDIAGFAALFEISDELRDLAIRAFSHIVGGLIVRLEDKQSVSFAPWCQIALDASKHVRDLVFPLRTLILQLLERVTDLDQRALLGQASRALLTHALSDEKLPIQILISGIDSVAKTYPTDRNASRDLLKRLLEPDRLKTSAYIDIPWLSREIKSIIDADPDFAVAIYRTAFGYSVNDTSATSMGGGQIMPLTSNKRQDYESAHYSLRLAFPHFLKNHPTAAVDALNGSVEGRVTNRHKIPDTIQELSITIGNKHYRLLDDLSHIWAYDPDGQHGEDSRNLLQSFTARLREAPLSEAVTLVEKAASKIRLAVIWARMFMVAAERPDIIGAILFPIARRREFLTSLDAGKDALDLVKAYYPMLSPNERTAFENDVVTVEFPNSSEPAETKLRFLRKVARVIGRENLATDLLRGLAPAEAQIADASLNANPRGFSIHTSVSTPAAHWWLREKKIDLSEPNIAHLLAKYDAVDSLTKVGQISDLQEALKILQELADSLVEARRSGVPVEAISYAEDCLAGACEFVAKNKDALSADAVALSHLCDLVEPMLDHNSPVVGGDTEPRFEKSMSSSGGVRVDATEAALWLCRVNIAVATRFIPKIRRLTHDPHPGVRSAIADRFRMFWETARDNMWGIATEISKNEKNRRVATTFAHSLSYLRDADSEKVEKLVKNLFPLVQDGVSTDSRDNLREIIGALVFLLSTINAAKDSSVILDNWLADLPSHEIELDHASSVSRNLLIAGYDTDDARENEIRRRAQKFAATLIDRGSLLLEESIENNQQPASAADVERARTAAKLLDHMGGQFFYASGVFQGSDPNERGLTSEDMKRAFLNDNYNTFLRLGDVSTPHTIYHLIEMLGFLMPADPAQVFDLTAHALLSAGKKHGYQFESLGADNFVKLISQFIADYRPLFADGGDRQEKLVACLDVFVEAGWPSARRLVYRLPELLQ